MLLSAFILAPKRVHDFCFRNLYKVELRTRWIADQERQSTLRGVDAEVAHVNIAGSERRRLRARALAGDGIEARGSMIGGENIERRTVGGPRGRRHQVLVADVAVRPIHTGAFEVPREAGGSLSVGIGGNLVEEGMSAGFRLVGGQQGYRLSIRRPGGRATGQRFVGEATQLIRLAINDRQGIDIRARHAPAIFGAIGAKDDLRAIGRPDGLTIVPITVRQLLRLRTSDIREEEVRAALIDIADTIEAIPEPVDDAHLRQRLAIFGLLRTGSHSGAKEQAAAVRRPDGRRGTVFHKGKLTRFSAIRWNEPELRLPFALFLLLLLLRLGRRTFAIGHKRQPLPIGRPCRITGRRALGGEAARISSISR